MSYLSFTSLAFIPFVVILVIITGVLKKESSRQLTILLFSIAFYLTWGWRSFVVLSIETVICFIWYQARNTRLIKKCGCVPIIIFLLLILTFFKYRLFFDAALFQGNGLITFKQIDFQPIGISFFTFSMISFVVDVNIGNIEEDISLTQLFMYILFFPKILQGPIHNSTEFVKQLTKEHKIVKANVLEGAQIFLFGLVKKVVIADRLGLFVDTVYKAPVAYDSISLILCIISYTIQLYCDFSGYTDMAIGTSKILGYNLTPNFNLPFLSQNISEYWRRWHMSLNQWFREYLFYPMIRAKWVNKLRKRAKNYLPKNFVNILPSIIGMIFVWPLIGLWHGASANYILHGLIYGIMMIISLIYGAFVKKRKMGSVYTVLRIIRTYLITVIMLTLFRSPDLITFVTVLSRIFNGESGVRYVYTWSLVYIPLVFISCIYAYIKNRGNSYHVVLDLSLFRNKVIISMVVILTLMFMYAGESYFMYFQF